MPLEIANNRPIRLLKATGKAIGLGLLCSLISDNYVVLVEDTANVPEGYDRQALVTLGTELDHFNFDFPSGSGSMTEYIIEFANGFKFSVTPENASTVLKTGSITTALIAAIYAK